jgi:carboxyl-terminal processing protease
VLVNRFSASAAEIVAACLQDNDVARLVGERTWGKGSVQNVIVLEDGRSALKLTTAGYHRPSGENIHREVDDSESDQWGVHPDDGLEVQLNGRQMQEVAALYAQRDELTKVRSRAGAREEQDDDPKSPTEAAQNVAEQRPAAEEKPEPEDRREEDSNADAGEDESDDGGLREEAPRADGGASSTDEDLENDGEAEAPDTGGDASRDEKELADPQLAKALEVLQAAVKESKLDDANSSRQQEDVSEKSSRSPAED